MKGLEKNTYLSKISQRSDDLLNPQRQNAKRARMSSDARSSASMRSSESPRMSAQTKNAERTRVSKDARSSASMRSSESPRMSAQRKNAKRARASSDARSSASMRSSESPRMSSGVQRKNAERARVSSDVRSSALMRQFEPPRMSSGVQRQNAKRARVSNDARSPASMRPFEPPRVSSGVQTKNAERARVSRDARSSASMRSSETPRMSSGVQRQNAKRARSESHRDNIVQLSDLFKISDDINFCKIMKNGGIGIRLENCIRFKDFFREFMKSFYEDSSNTLSNLNYYEPLIDFSYIYKVNPKEDYNNILVRSYIDGEIKKKSDSIFKENDKLRITSNTDIIKILAEFEYLLDFNHNRLLQLHLYCIIQLCENYKKNNFAQIILIDYMLRMVEENAISQEYKIRKYIDDFIFSQIKSLQNAHICTKYETDKQKYIIIKDRIFSISNTRVRYIAAQLINYIVSKNMKKDGDYKTMILSLNKKNLIKIKIPDTYKNTDYTDYQKQYEHDNQIRIIILKETTRGSSMDFELIQDVIDEEEMGLSDFRKDKLTKFQSSVFNYLLEFCFDYTPFRERKGTNRLKRAKYS